MNDLYPPPCLLDEGLELLAEQDVGRALVPAQQPHLQAVAGCVGDLVERLVHGRDACPATDHVDLALPFERVLRLDVELDVLEADHGAHLEVVQPLRDHALLVDLDHQVEASLRVIRARRRVGPDGGLALFGEAAHQNARAYRQVQRHACAGRPSAPSSPTQGAYTHANTRTLERHEGRAVQAWASAQAAQQGNLREGRT